MMKSEVTPSAAAEKLVRMRWRNTGWAMVLTSSMATCSRPARTAQTLAPRTRNWLARGPAPEELTGALREAASSGLPVTREVALVGDQDGGVLGWCDDQAEFEFALALLLDGLDRRLSRA